MEQGDQQWIGTVVSFGVLAVVLALRMRKMRQVRPLKVERLWMLPAFYAVVVAALYYTHPPQGVVWLYALAALGVGLAVGWYRGKLMSIIVNAQTQEVSQQGSMAAMLFIVALVGLRFLARSFANSGSNVDPAIMFSATDVLLALCFGFIAAQRLEMSMRAKSLLAQARGETP